MAKKEIIVTDETRAVVDHYLQKQWARREKRLMKKAAKYIKEINEKTDNINWNQ